MRLTWEQKLFAYEMHRDWRHVFRKEYNLKLDALENSSLTTRLYLIQNHCVLVALQVGNKHVDTLYVI